MVWWTCTAVTAYVNLVLVCRHLVVGGEVHYTSNHNDDKLISHQFTQQTVEQFI